LLAGTAGFGFLAGPKIAAGFCLILGAAGMGFFLSRWTGSRLAAWLGGVLFVFQPSLLTRAAEFEHFVVVASMAALPWVLWAIAGFFRNGTRRHAVVLGVCFSALTLAYGKTALMAAPLLGAFALVLYFSEMRASRPPWGSIGFAAMVVFVLAAVPNFPALRESGFVAMFEFGPFEGWQRAFSTKSALGWFDRGGALGAGMDPGYAPTTAANGMYLGLVAGLLIATALMRGAIHSSPTGRAARTLLALALGAFWLSFGPRSVIGGHFEFLRLSAGAADFTPALAWFLLVAQVWGILRLLPSKSVPWLWAGAGLSLVYLFVPGFRILERLPVYQNIRAPFDFYQVTGVIFATGAVALAAASFLEKISSARLRICFAAGLVALAAWDMSTQAKSFFTARMDRAVWEDFTAAQDFLKSAPVEGRVHPFSGRYFYLMTPWMSGRPLTTEAFNSYLQQRNAAVLQSSATLVDGYLESLLRISGSAYLLMDKTDPDTPADLQERLRKMCEPVFENTHFAVLAVPNPLGSAFLARDFVLAPDDAPVNAMAALGGAEHNLAMIEGTGLPTDEPGLQGRVVEGRIAAKEGGVLEDGRPFLAVSKKGASTYERFEFEPTG
ncbi:MAG: 6-pyruvoyl-tetrahydropterin synthase-related protein, partial [Verrucomicrobiota bacterium]